MFFITCIIITVAFCPANGINCDDNDCERCLPRFTGQGCCDCEDGYYLNMDDYQCEGRYCIVYRFEKTTLFHILFTASELSNRLMLMLLLTS